MGRWASLMGLATEADTKVAIAEACLPALVEHLNCKDINIAENAKAVIQSANVHKEAKPLVQAALCREQDREFVFG